MVVQPQINFPTTDHPLKGNWKKNFFKNNYPIILELGCGRGEYTICLAEKTPDKNFIGIDIKGARIWKGGKTASESSMQNVGFLRIQIEHIENYFATDEVEEIWITFPDPQPQKSREKKRLTSLRFIEKYKKILVQDAIIHLKTDNKNLFDYTVELLNKEGHIINILTHNLHKSEYKNDVLSITTTYEKKFMEQEIPICYLNFTLK